MKSSFCRKLPRGLGTSTPAHLSVRIVAKGE